MYDHALSISCGTSGRGNINIGRGAENFDILKASKNESPSTGEGSGEVTPDTVLTGSSSNEPSSNGSPSSSPSISYEHHQQPRVVGSFVASIIKKLQLWCGGSLDLEDGETNSPDKSRVTIMRHTITTRHPIKKVLAERCNDGISGLYKVPSGQLIRCDTLIDLVPVYIAFISAILRYADRDLNMNPFVKGERDFSFCYRGGDSLLRKIIESDNIKLCVYYFLDIHCRPRLNCIWSGHLKNNEIMLEIHTLEKEEFLNKKNAICSDRSYHHETSNKKGRGIKILTLDSLVVALMYNKKLSVKDKGISRIASLISNGRRKPLRSRSVSEFSCGPKEFLNKFLMSPEVTPTKEITRILSRELSESIHRARSLLADRVLARSNAHSFYGNKCGKPADDNTPLMDPALCRGFNFKKKVSAIARACRDYERTGCYLTKFMRKLRESYKKLRRQLSKLKMVTLKRVYDMPPSAEDSPEEKKFDKPEPLYSNPWRAQGNNYTNAMSTVSPRSAEMIESEIARKMIATDFFDSLVTPKSPCLRNSDDSRFNIKGLYDDHDECEDEEIIVVEGLNEDDAFATPEIHRTPGHRIEILSVSNVRRGSTNSKKYKKMAADNIFKPENNKKTFLERVYRKLSRSQEKNIIPFSFKVSSNVPCDFEADSLASASGDYDDPIYPSICNLMGEKFVYDSYGRGANMLSPGSGHLKVLSDTSIIENQKKTYRFDGKIRNRDSHSGGPLHATNWSAPGSEELHHMRIEDDVFTHQNSPQQCDPNEISGELLREYLKLNKSINAKYPKQKNGSSDNLQSRSSFNCDVSLTEGQTFGRYIQEVPDQLKTIYPAVSRKLSSLSRFNGHYESAVPMNKRSFSTMGGFSSKMERSSRYTGSAHRSKSEARKNSTRPLLPKLVVNTKLDDYSADNNTKRDQSGRSTISLRGCSDIACKPVLNPVVHLISEKNLNRCILADIFIAPE